MGSWGDRGVEVRKERSQEIAIEMLKKGMKIDLISQLTGLSKQALSQLKAEL